MDFKQFAEPLVNTVYAHLNRGLAVKQMFLDITDFSDVDSNPFLKPPESTFRGYLQAGHGITKAARSAVAHIDKEKFADVVYGLSSDAAEALLREYQDSIPAANALNIGNKLAEEFEKILGAAASGETHRSQPRSCREPQIEQELIAETRGHCPQCGLPIAKTGRAKRYDAVGIIPPAAKADYRIWAKYSDAVPQMPVPGSLQDKIVLCTDCAARYREDQSVSKFQEILNLKTKLRKNEDLLFELASLNLEEDLPLLLSKLGHIRDFTELESLSLTAMRVREKIKPQNQLLISKIESLVSIYYNFIREQCQILELQGDLCFELMAQQIRCCYLKLRNSGLDQDEIFERVKCWMTGKIGWERQIECEVLVAFFVQNCEVFDVITE